MLVPGALKRVLLATVFATAVLDARADRSREALLRNAEDTLRGGDAKHAALLFEQAASLRHAADAEIGVARAYMQAGRYRHALAFAAHIAGAHADSKEGRALYGQLLEIGGQAQIAERLIGRLPRNGSSKFAPYSLGDSFPEGARVTASGVLNAKGSAALAPAVAVRDARRVWVRNGLGRVAKARVARSFADIHLVELELDQAFDEVPLSTPPRNPFPGSLAFMIEYSAAPDAAPAWPTLRSGFLGKAAQGTEIYELGIDAPPGPRGGPVFDEAGRLVGIAAAERLVLASLLRARFAGLSIDSPSAPKPQTLAVDEIYERALRSTLQIIVAY